MCCGKSIYWSILCQDLGSIYGSIFVVGNGEYLLEYFGGEVVTICNNIVIICNYKETREKQGFPWLQNVTTYYRIGYSIVKIWLQWLQNNYKLLHLPQEFFESVTKMIPFVVDYNNIL